MTIPERSVTGPAKATNPDSSPTEDLWSGHSRLLAFWEPTIALLLAFCAVVTVLTTLGIVLVLSIQTVEFFMKSKVGILDFLFGTELNPDTVPPKFGILPLAWGTFAVAFGSSCIALPIGLLSAIYLSEYAPRRLRGILKPALELLAEKRGSRIRGSGKATAGEHEESDPEGQDRGNAVLSQGMNHRADPSRCGRLYRPRCACPWGW